MPGKWFPRPPLLVTIAASCIAVACSRGQRPLQAYANHVLVSADSVYLLLVNANIVDDTVIQRLALELDEPLRDSPPYYSRTRKPVLVRSMQRRADDFDAVTPPPGFERIHAQLAASTHGLAEQLGNEHERAMGRAFYLEVNDLEGRKEAERRYCDAKGRLAQLLRERGVVLDSSLYYMDSTLTRVALPCRR